MVKRQTRQSAKLLLAGSSPASASTDTDKDMMQMAVAHGHNRGRDDVHPVPGGPFVVTIYCYCNQSFSCQNYSRGAAQRTVKRRLKAHVKTSEGK